MEISLPGIFEFELTCVMELDEDCWNFHLNVPVRTSHYNPNLFVWNVSWIICIKFD